MVTFVYIIIAFFLFILGLLIGTCVEGAIKDYLDYKIKRLELEMEYWK